MVYFSFKEQINSYSKAKFYEEGLYWKERRYVLKVVILGKIQIFSQGRH